MTVYNLGSINADHVYAVPHLPVAGETLAATALQRGLGGKGANQSVAMAQAGAKVVHMGAVGPDGAWATERLQQLGVDCSAVATVSTPTGHAIVCVDPGGENQIVLFPGANRALPDQVLAPLQHCGAGDWLVLQNETNLQCKAAQIARQRGARVAYSAAPFTVEAVQNMLGLCDMIIMNAGEAAQLSRALGCDMGQLPVPVVVVTRGAEGADWHDTRNAQQISMPAHKVQPIDTTGAGDTFAGFLIAALHAGASATAALQLASAAAALKVTRPGTADAIPSMAQVQAFMA